MAMTQKEKKQAQILGIVVALAASALLWNFWRAPIMVVVTELNLEMDTLRAQTDTIRTQLRSGSAEEIEARINSYNASLVVMRQLVPDQNEVTRLIDDITSRARRRGVRTTDYRPAVPVGDGPYQVASYGFTVIGTYDDIGAFLSDVASLPRIMVPTDLSLSMPDDGLPPDLARDSSKVYLIGDFNVLAYVKRAAGETLENDLDGSQ
jgi:type IV pilus assembly protein PilO